MIILCYLASIINSVLIAVYTDIRPADAVWWLWIFVPIVTYIVGREVERKLRED